MSGLRTSIAFILLFSVCACTVGPKYKRPPVTLPDQYRGQPSDTPQQRTGEAFGDLKWAAVFQDETLQGLIKEALTNNYDIRIAASRSCKLEPSWG